MKKNFQILIVEDEPVNLELISDILRVRGYQILSAGNGVEAIETAKKHRPDLILMDVQLPEMDGYEAARRIKGDPDLKNIPIIAVTSFAMKGDREKAIKAGCNEYVIKPIDTRKLPKLVDGFFNRKAKPK